MFKLHSSIGWFLGLILLASSQSLSAAPREFADLEAALRAARRGAPLQGVSSAIGEAAAAEIPTATTGALVPLSRVAGAGGATASACRALLERYFAEQERVCLVALLELPHDETNQALAKEKLALEERATSDPSPLVLALFGRIATASKIRGLLENWSRDDTRSESLAQLLRALGGHYRPEKMFKTLLQTHDLGLAEANLCQTLGALVKRDSATRKRALAVLEKDKRRDRVAAALALAGEGRSKAVRAALESSLGKAETAPNALTGILAARACRPQALARAVALTKEGKAAPAALAALPRLLSYCKKASKEERAAADRAIGAALESPDVATLVAALNAARQTRHSELPKRLPDLARHGAGTVRQAAIRAIPRVLELASSSVDLLMARFDDSDPKIANLAWKTLQRWAKVSIPLNRRELWRTWRGKNF